MVRKLAPPYKVYHIHTLVPERIERRLGHFKKKYYSSFLLPENIVCSRMLVKELSRHVSIPATRVITMVREPVSTVVSDWWENNRKNYDPAECDEKLLFGRLREFIGRSIHGRLDWFDNELKRTLNFDVYTRKFDKKKGFSFYSPSKDAPDVLVVKLEKLKECYTDALGKIFDEVDIPLGHARTAGQKANYRYYQHIKNSVKLPEKLLDEIYGSKYTRHFYTDEEIRGYRRKYSE
jgi:hypothetical protein